MTLELLHVIRDYTIHLQGHQYQIYWQYMRMYFQLCLLHLWFIQVRQYCVAHLKVPGIYRWVVFGSNFHHCTSESYFHIKLMFGLVICKYVSNVSSNAPSVFESKPSAWLQTHIQALFQNRNKMTN